MAVTKLYTLLFSSIAHIVWTAPCDPNVCMLPECFCAGTVRPPSVSLDDTPQMLMLSFDDAVLKKHEAYYERLFFSKHHNPSGCPILATFFVCHNWTDYDLVKRLHQDGHEIASHTKTHRMPQSWWTYASYGDWESELEGERDNLGRLAGIPKQEIQGARVPYLETGGDAQFQMMTDTGYIYDSSFMTGPFTEGGVWPFTLHYPPSTTYCSNINCPKKSYPKLWEIPLNRWVGPNGKSCPMMDACDRQPKDKEDAKAYLMKNFNRHYRGNRAPMGMHLHAEWFDGEGGYKLEALEEFIEDVLEKGDVYLVTMTQVLQWMADPQTKHTSPYFKPWKTSCSDSYQMDRDKTKSTKNRKVTRLKNGPDGKKTSRSDTKLLNGKSKVLLSRTTTTTVQPTRQYGPEGTKPPPKPVTARPRLPYYTRPKAQLPLFGSINNLPKPGNSLYKQNRKLTGKEEARVLFPTTPNPFGQSVHNPMGGRQKTNVVARMRENIHGLPQNSFPNVEGETKTKVYEETVRTMEKKQAQVPGTKGFSDNQRQTEEERQLKSATKLHPEKEDEKQISHNVNNVYSSPESQAGAGISGATQLLPYSNILVTGFALFLRVCLAKL